MFKCFHGECIRKELTCNGNNDCGDYPYDEVSSVCPGLIWSGDKIALRNGYHSNLWLGCYCQSSTKCNFVCELNGCPGSYYKIDDIYRCPFTIFRLYVVDRKGGPAVRSGDAINLLIDPYTNWNFLDCTIGPFCTQKRWSGQKFWIYSPERHGSCKGHIGDNCLGDPIYEGDNVFLLIDRNKGRWLSAYNWRFIEPSGCPRYDISEDDKTLCKGESWFIKQTHACAWVYNCE